MYNFILQMLSIHSEILVTVSNKQNKNKFEVRGKSLIIFFKTSYTIVLPSEKMQRSPSEFQKLSGFHLAKKVELSGEPRSI